MPSSSDQDLDGEPLDGSSEEEDDKEPPASRYHASFDAEFQAASQMFMRGVPGLATLQPLESKPSGSDAGQQPAQQPLESKPSGSDAGQQPAQQSLQQ